MKNLYFTLILWVTFIPNFCFSSDSDNDITPQISRSPISPFYDPLDGPLRTEPLEDLDPVRVVEIREEFMQRDIAEEYREHAQAEALREMEFCIGRIRARGMLINWVAMLTQAQTRANASISSSLLNIDISIYRENLVDDPKREGKNYTSRELSVASALLQKAISQSEEGYLLAFESVFSKERCLALLTDIAAGEDNSDNTVTE